MKLSTQILLAFTTIILLSLADSYTNYLLTRKVERNTNIVANSESIIRKSNKTHRAIIDMQSSFRGYLLTDDTTFLDAYYKSKKNVPIFLNELKQLTRNKQEQAVLLDSILLIHNHWVNYSGQLIESKSDPSKYEILFETRMKKQVGKKLNDSITKKFVRFDRIEYTSREYHRSRLLNSISNTHTISLIFLTLTFIVGIASTIYIVMLISSRIAKMVKVAEKISLGDFTIVKDNSNDELTGLSTSLNVMSVKLSKNIRELENRNAELSKFAYVVSHDLKAPIRGIHNVVKWIEEDLHNELSPQMVRYLMIIPERTKRMEALINGLLDYAKISHATQPEDVDVNALVHNIADTLVPRDFELHIDNLPEIYTERLKLEQVFANLISNAVKYTPHEYGKIGINCIEKDNHYQFSVKDNGIGIDTNYHKKIFEIFQTLREKDEKESTGIGLAIVKKILDDRQESIQLISEAGKGSEFIFTWKKSNL